MKTLLPLIFILFVLGSLSFVRSVAPEPVPNNYWVKFCNDSLNCGYINANGDTMIPAGKYLTCWTDTFRAYALVTSRTQGIIGINKQEKFLYSVWIFDNAPDPVSEGRFRITKNGLIGFADERTGKVMIYPQYKCAFPYENSVADVSFDCDVTPRAGKEPFYWSGGQWFYIDHAGSKAPSPEH